ncbi:hypothetical protein SLEP1_g25727 [Rubroshorea leprosula]|uniref:Uncharacterized protein n=1 Tax=Rubroshorea leprosula TaxID=152421 RepID=A0AAV5JR78_9ROSI|nr:hypothetical protein SLEP1_g25727 [Rubroshorea leprosula]
MKLRTGKPQEVTNFDGIRCDMISSKPCALVGLVSRVYGVCHVLGFGFWGVTLTIMVN